MESKSNYKVEDIDKYLTNKMSDKDMHNLERQAMYDPFLSDALDGLNTLETTSRNHHISQINEALRQRTRPKKRILPLRTRRLVASFILLITCSTLFILYRFDQPDDQLTKSTPEMSTEDSYRDLTKNNTDSMASVSSVKPQDQVLETNSVVENLNQSIEQKKEISQKKLPTNDHETLAYAEEQDFGQTPRKKVLSGVQFELPKIDSMNTLVLAEPAPITEMVSVGSAMKDKVPDVVKRKAKNVNTDDAFDFFVKQHLIYPDLAQKNSVRGVVKVRFVIRKNGKITNIKIMKKLGFGCDQESIRLVKKYPHWKKQMLDSTSRKMTKLVDISFP